MTKTEQAIEQLEKAEGICSCPALSYIIEALSLLQQPACEMCGDSGEVPDDGDDLGGVCGAAFEVNQVKKPCPDCQPSAMDCTRYKEALSLLTDQAKTIVERGGEYNALHIDFCTRGVELAEQKELHQKEIFNLNDRCVKLRTKQAEEIKRLKEENRQSHKCRGCGEIIYYQDYCGRCKRQRES